MPSSNAAEVPASYSKNLCACIGCHLVKTKDQVRGRLEMLESVNSGASKMRGRDHRRFPFFSLSLALLLFGTFSLLQGEEALCDPRTCNRKKQRGKRGRGKSLPFDAVVADAAAVKISTSTSLSLSLSLQNPLPPPPQQFFDAGCENCAFLAIEGDRDRLDACTTVEFSGVVSVLKPSASWCAKWLRVENAVPGCYAISVRPPAEGMLPDDVVEELEHRGIDWRGEGR